MYGEISSSHTPTVGFHCETYGEISPFTPAPIRSTEHLDKQIDSSVQIPFTFLRADNV